MEVVELQVGRATVALAIGVDDGQGVEVGCFLLPGPVTQLGEVMLSVAIWPGSSDGGKSESTRWAGIIWDRTRFARVRGCASGGCGRLGDGCSMPRGSVVLRRRGSVCGLRPQANLDFH